MKKILFCIFDLKGGGAEKVLTNFINCLNPKEWEVTVLALFGVGENIKNIPQWVNLRFVFKRQFRGFTNIMKLLSPKHLHKIIVGNSHYDLEIAYLETSPTRIISGAPKTTKTIAWVHTTETSPKAFIKTYRSYKEELECYRQFDHIAFVSEDAKDIFCKNHPQFSEKSSVVHNVINIDEIIAKSKEDISIFHPDCINIVSVGRLTKVKGYDRLLEVVKKLNQDGLGNSFKLYLIGSGEMESELINYCKCNNISNVSFLGFQSNPYKYIARADLFVSSSYREGYSTAVSESIILRTPVITTNTSGMSEILRDGVLGLIVNNDTESILQGLKQLISTPQIIRNYKNNIAKITNSNISSNFKDNLTLLRSVLN